MKLQDIPEDIEPQVGDILEIEQGDVCFEVRIIGITADGYLCEQDNIQGAILLEGTGLDEADATDIEDFLRSGGRVERIPYKNTRKEKGAAFRFGSKHIGAAGGSGKGKQVSGLGAATSAKGNKPVVTAGYDPELDEEKVRLDPKCWKGKKIGNPKTKMKGGVRVNNCVPEGQEDIEESGLQYYTGVKKHGEKYMKLAAKAGREGASQEELGRLRDRYSKAEKTDEGMGEGRFDEPLTGYHIVYRNSGNPVHATPSFETKEQAQKYLMTKMFANHQDFKVVHTASVGMAEGSDLPPKVIEMIKKIAQSSASPEHKKAAIDALVAKYSKKGVAEAGIDPTLGPRGRDRDMRRIDPGPEEKYYFQVPFELKTLAKDMGLRWDPDKKKWFTTSILTKTQAEKKFKPWKGVAEMDNRTAAGDRREQRAYSPEKLKQREKELQADLKKVSPEMRKKLRLPEPKEGVAEGRYTPPKNTYYITQTSINSDEGRSVDVFDLMYNGKIIKRYNLLASADRQLRRLRAAGNPVQMEDEQGVAEGSSEYKDSYENEQELYSGCYVRDQQEGPGGEVFVMHGDPEDRRVRIEDKDGRGWYISPSRLELVDENDPAIRRYFGGMAEGSLNELDTSTLKSYKKKASDEVNAFKEKEKLGQLSDKDFFKKQDRLMGITGASKRIDKRGITGVAEGADLDQGFAQPDTLKEYSFAEKQTYMKFLAAKAKKYGVQSLKPEERSELMAYLQAQKMAKEQQNVQVPGTEGVKEAEYQGRKVQLGKKMAGDVKKSKVYVRKPNGKVVKVNFGDKDMKIKKSNPARRKSFRARHNCDNPGPRWKARYWSCRSW